MAGVKGQRGGFSVMDKERHREIARKGGRMAHLKGTAHEWTSEEAAAAGRKGGSKRSPKQRAHAATVAAKGWETRRLIGA